MYTSQFRKIDPYDWFCGPGSHIHYIGRGYRYYTNYINAKFYNAHYNWDINWSGKDSLYTTMLYNVKSQMWLGWKLKSCGVEYSDSLCSLQLSCIFRSDSWKPFSLSCFWLTLELLLYCITFNPTQRWHQKNMYFIYFWEYQECIP